MEYEDGDIVWNGRYLKALDEWSVNRYCARLWRRICNIRSSYPEREGLLARRFEQLEARWRLYHAWNNLLQQWKPSGLCRDRNGKITLLDQEEKYSKPKVDKCTVDSVQRALIYVRRYVGRLKLDRRHFQEHWNDPSLRQSPKLSATLAHQDELNNILQDMFAARRQAEVRASNARADAEVQARAARRADFLQREKKRDDRAKKRAGQTCFACGKIGHLKRECPSKPNHRK